MPPVGKRKHKGQSPSDPKGIESNKRVKEFPSGKLMVSGGSFACREEIGLKRSTIKNHVHSKKHEIAKQRYCSKKHVNRTLQ